MDIGLGEGGEAVKRICPLCRGEFLGGLMTAHGVICWDCGIPMINKQMESIEVRRKNLEARRMRTFPDPFAPAPEYEI